MNILFLYVKVFKWITIHAGDCESIIRNLKCDFTLCMCACLSMCLCLCLCFFSYGVATVGRIDRIIGLFCRILSLV